MWWERNASPPRSRQKVFFSSAPQPSTGSAAVTASGIGSGAYPRERRIG